MEDEFGTFSFDHTQGIIWHDDVPKSKIVDKELDEIYTAIDALMKAGCWNFLNEFFEHFCQRVWRTDINILLGYATASLPGKSKIKSREKFIRTCKHLFPDVELWKGLD